MQLVGHCATSRKIAGSIPEFFIDILLPAALWPMGRLILEQQRVPLMLPRAQRRPVPRADNLTTFMARLSINLGATTSWNPQGLSRPV